VHDSFTDRARRVLAVARSTAVDRGGSEVLPEDLLMGLALGDGPAGRVLDELGLRSALVRRHATAAGVPHRSAPGPGEPPLSPVLLRVLDRAREQPRPAEPVDAHHLLLALLAVDDRETRRIVTAAGVPPRVLRDHLLAAVNDEPAATAPPPVRVFISYRRQQARHVAGRIADWLADRVEGAEVFLDVHSIRPGVDFTEAITDAIDSCTALVAVIGPGWAELTDECGRRRLAQPDDVVRLEVETALRRAVPVIPVLVDGARMPDAGSLPEGLAPLAFRNALEIRHESFRQDVARLAEAVAGS
jgi:hypothetical protein